MKNSRYGCFISHRLTLKLQTKATKTKQCSTETCLQIIVLLNITINTSIKNGKQVNKNTTALPDIFSFGKTGEYF